jgi:hypothetical protein
MTNGIEYALVVVTPTRAVLGAVATADCLPLYATELLGATVLPAQTVINSPLLFALF